MFLISSVIILLGIYGMITTRKLYERQMFHFERSRSCLDELDMTIVAGRLKTLRAEAEARNKAKFPWMSRIPNHQVWMGLHAVLVLFGLAMFLLSVFGKLKP